MAERKPASRAKSSAAKPATDAVKPAGSAAWPDGYEGLDWNLYKLVRPNKTHTGATGAGLVEYTLWFEVIRTRPVSHRHDVGIPGQPVR